MTSKQKIIAAATTTLSMVLPAAVQAQISLTGATYTQNFDALPFQTGTAALVTTFVNNTTIAGWYAQNSVALSGGNPVLRAEAGSGNSGGVYSYGSAGSTERAFGAVGSGTSATNYIAVQFTNNTAFAIDSFTLAYTGEQWRAGQGQTAAGDSITVDYGALATGPNAGTYTNIPAATFAGLQPGTTGAAVVLDGNVAANRTAISTNYTPINVIAPGQTFWLRFVKPNAGGNDHGLAIDDFSFSYNLIPPPPSADLVFDATPGGTPQDGSGTWVDAESSGSAHWYNPNTGVNTGYDSGFNGTGNSPTFGTGNAGFPATATVTADASGVVANKITFAAAGSVYTLAGGPIFINQGIAAQKNATITSNVTIVTDNTWSVDTGATLDVQGNVAGQALTKTGLGTLKLSGTNSFSKLAFSAGVVEVASAPSLGSGVEGQGGTLRFLNSMTTLGPGNGVGQFFNFTSASTIDTNGKDVVVLGDVLGSAGFTKIGAGTLTMTNGSESAPAQRYTGVATINAGTIKLNGLATDFATPDWTALGTGTAVVNSGGTLLIDSIIVGRAFASIGLKITLNGGSTLVGVGGNNDASVGQTGQPSFAGVQDDSLTIQNFNSVVNGGPVGGGHVTIATTNATDVFTFTDSIRQQVAVNGTTANVNGFAESDTNTTIHVAGPGLTVLKSGYTFVQTSGFAGSWSVDAGSSLQIGPLGTTGFQGSTGAGDTVGEPLNALGNKMGKSGFGTGTAQYPYVGNAVTINAGASLAIAVDQPNPTLFINGDLSALPTPTPPTYTATSQPPAFIRNPIVLNGGAISATDFQVAVLTTDPVTGRAATTGSTTTAVQANLGGDLTINDLGAGSSKFLTYDDVGTRNGGSTTALNRNVNLVSTGNTTWNGKLIIDPGSASTSGVTTFARTGGTVLIGTNAALQVGTGVGGTLATAKFAGAQVTADGTNSVALSVLTGGKVVLDSTLTQALKVKTLSTTGSGTVDVTNRFLIIDQGDLATATAAVKAAKGTKVTGSSNGSGVLHDGQYNYTGTGIGSSSVLAGNLAVGYDKYSVGVIKNSDLTALGQTAYAAFNGVTAATNAILVRYTYSGDANLDGVVDSLDYALINQGFASPAVAAKGWVAGDFTLDGLVNADDYAVIDFAFLTGGNTPLSGAFDPVAVPEPTSLSLLALGGAALMGRRRRNA